MRLLGRISLTSVLAGLVFSFAASLAQADDIVEVITSGITFNGSCGGSPCTEVFATTGEWDINTSSVVPGTAMVSTSGSGPLVGFTFTGPIGPTVAQPTFLFSSGTDVFEAVSSGTAFPAVGVYPLSANPNLNTFFILQCGTASCVNFLGGSTSSDADPTQGVVTISAVPEPASLLLLGTGLLGVVGAARRKWLG
jgi:PEP-CTERM motif-containing protein